MRYRQLSVVSLMALRGFCSDAGTGTGELKDTSNQITITQGLWGNLWSGEGDIMPSTSGTQ